MINARVPYSCRSLIGALGGNESRMLATSFVVAVAFLVVIPTGDLLIENAPRCLVPFDGAYLSRNWKEALWGKFYTGAPRRQRRSVERYNIVKRCSKSRIIAAHWTGC